ncbi:hypothetical protein CI238_06071 [Colletotrichum incanum]|uniref:Uncharacterized protein n=1 Tax=Colletotrichum incanum TaxID=1573173 RepID=A0A166L6Q8_COLIC|nr:hypothetical protein CI238_06071 [Colletotrichum incanum]
MDKGSEDKAWGIKIGRRPRDQRQAMDREVRLLSRMKQHVPVTSFTRRPFHVTIGLAHGYWLFKVLFASTATE